MILTKITFPALAGTFLACVTPLHAQDIMEIPLSIGELPADLWSKNRLTPERIENGLRMRDTGEGEFDDASFWQIKFDQDLPYGRKLLSVNVTVAASPRRRWQAIFHKRCCR